MSKIKICGIFREEDADIINEARPDYFGMILNFPRSHRNISIRQAAFLRERVCRDIPAVGVFVDQQEEDILRLLEAGIIDIAQLHGQESPETVRRLQMQSSRPIWKAFRIRTEADLLPAAQSPADLILLDSGYGSGESFPWDLVRGLDRPFALAGGLTPENIPDALRLLHPAVIDISSGVEKLKKKDRAMVLAAVAAARAGTDER